MKKLLLSLALVINGVINAENIVDANFASSGSGVLGSSELSLRYKHLEKNSLYGKTSIGMRTINTHWDGSHFYNNSTFINGALGYTFTIDTDKMLSPYIIIEDDVLDKGNMLNLGVGAELNTKYNDQVSWGIVFEYLRIDPTERNSRASMSSTFFSAPVKYSFTEQLSANFGPNISITRVSTKNDSKSKLFIGIHGGLGFKF